MSAVEFAGSAITSGAQSLVKRRHPMTIIGKFRRIGEKKPSFSIPAQCSPWDVGLILLIFSVIVREQALGLHRPQSMLAVFQPCSKSFDSHRYPRRLIFLVDLDRWKCEHCITGGWEYRGDTDPFRLGILIYSTIK